MSQRLTLPQIAELGRLSLERQPSYGSSRARVQNTLKRLGLAEQDPSDWAKTMITDAGRAALASGLAPPEPPRPARKEPSMIPIRFTAKSGKTYEVVLHVVADKITGDYLNSIELRQPVDIQDARELAREIDGALQKVGY